MGILNEGASLRLRQGIMELELALVRLITDDPDFLSFPQATSLRWALSLARITKVLVLVGHKKNVVEIGHATDQYRARFYALLSSAQTPLGQFNKEKVKEIQKPIEKLVQNERKELLDLFRGRLPPQALDEAVRRRPLALCLSGGGGTSYVFAGAFLALEDSGIRPDALSGSSMGAIMAAYRARTVHFNLDALHSLVTKVTWNRIAQPFTGQSRFGVPATFRLYLRDVVGHEFEKKGGGFLTLKDMPIPLRICIAGFVKTLTQPLDLERYANLIEVPKANIYALRAYDRGIVSAIMEAVQKPLKAIYLGGDDLTKNFDVLDAMGFSAAIPGVFHYDILRDDPRMVGLLEQLLDREGVYRLIDGGFVDNLPVKEAIRAIQEGHAFGFDPFALALDGFSPSLHRNWLFYPLMRLAMENSREGHATAHLSIRFKNVLSPIHFVPDLESFQYAVQEGQKEFEPHIPFIRKMLGPIPDPSWLESAS